MKNQCEYTLYLKQIYEYEGQEEVDNFVDYQEEYLKICEENFEF